MKKRLGILVADDILVKIPGKFHTCSGEIADITQERIAPFAGIGVPTGKDNETDSLGCLPQAFNV